MENYVNFCSTTKKSEKKILDSMDEINPRGMTFLEVVKRYPEQVVKAMKRQSKVYQSKLSLINKVNALVCSPNIAPDKKVKRIKDMITTWTQKEFIEWPFKKD